MIFWSTYESFFEIMSVISRICSFAPIYFWWYWSLSSTIYSATVLFFIDFEPIFWDGSDCDLLHLLQMPAARIGIKDEVQGTYAGEGSLDFPNTTYF